MDDSNAVIRSFAALVDSGDMVARSFLMAATYAVAVADDSTPRSVLEALFIAMPADESWPTLKEALLSCLHE